MTFPWYLHAAANTYQHRNKIARATTAYYAIKTARRTMGYLRGSNKIVPYSRPYSSSKPTTRLATELKSIHRKLNKQKPETKHWFHNWNFTATAAVTARHDLDLTQTFHADPAFRDNVLGDKWRNLRLQWRMRSNSTNVSGVVRMIVYKPKVPGATWPGLSINSIVDPNDHTVLFDRIVKPMTGSTTGNITNDRLIATVYYINLRNTLTSYDTAIRKGDIKIAILTEAEVGAFIIDNSLMLSYQNV